MRPAKTDIEPISNAVHLCIDMQNIFSKGGLWETPWMERVLPTILTLTAWKAERTIFTRFISPENARQAAGPMAEILPLPSLPGSPRQPWSSINLVTSKLRDLCITFARKCRE
jgi:nicotinamidase-related amidase